MPRGRPRDAGIGGFGSGTIWSGTLSFGLIAMPVRLVSAVRDSAGEVSFNMIDARDHARLRRVMYCPKHERVVDDDEIVRGYEIESGRFIPLEDEEIAQADRERSESIEVQSFVPLTDIDPLYYDHPYYVDAAGAKKPYALLTAVLESEGVAGVAEVVLRDREHLALLRALGGRLVLFTLRYQGELRSAADIVPASRPDKKAVGRYAAALKKLAGKLHADDLAHDEDDKLRAALKKLVESGAGRKAARKKAS